MVCFIINSSRQSPLKGIARGTQNFLGDQGPFPLQFGLQILERIMRSSAGFALEDGPHPKVQRIQVRAPWGPLFLADERLDVGLNPPLRHSWAMWGRRVLLEGPRCSIEVLSGPWQQLTFQNVRDEPLAVQFHSWGHENEGRPSSGCDGRPNHNRGWILASTHSPAFHVSIPTPNTVVLMVDALLNVKFLLVREHQIGQNAFFHEVQKVATSFDPHSFMRGCELMALLHLVGDGLEVLLKDAAHRSLADSSLCGQFGCQTTEICPQLVPRVFYHSLGSYCPLSALARSIGCLASLPELLNHFPNRFTLNMKLFWDCWITFTLFIEAYDCFSVYSHRKNYIYTI